MKIDFLNKILLGSPFQISLPPSALRALSITASLQSPLKLLKSVANNLLKSIKIPIEIYILTGFPCNNFYETDGPVGAFFLAEFLSQLYSSIIIIADKKLIGILDRVFSEVFGHDHQVQFKAIDEIKSFDDSLLISIEYPGENEKKVCHSMSGKRIYGMNYFIESLIESKPPKYWLAIGDGGNEIGLGRFASVTNRILTENGECKCGCGGGIAATAVANDVILGFTSNYAAIALIYELSKRSERNWALNWDKFEKIMEKLNQNVILDGITNESKSVDSISLSRLKKYYEYLKDYYSNHE